MSLLEVRDLTKSFRPAHRLFQRHQEPRRPAVDGVSFRLEEGETLALVGESGAGKSTTGRLVLRLIEPDHGTILFRGQNIADLDTRRLRAWRQHAQMIFQDPYTSFDPRLTIGDSIGEPLAVHFGKQGEDQRRQGVELLKRVGMSHVHMDRYPSELSGGQLQRAAVARALTVHPSFIVCDEPVAALDVSIRAQVLNLFKDLQEEMGLSYLFISHDLALIQVIADRVAVMKDGQIVETATTAELFENARHPYTRELLGAIPRPRRVRTTQPVAPPANRSGVEP